MTARPPAKLVAFSCGLFQLDCPLNSDWTQSRTALNKIQFKRIGNSRQRRNEEKGTRHGARKASQLLSFPREHSLSLSLDPSTRPLYTILYSLEPHFSLQCGQFRPMMSYLFISFFLSCYFRTGFLGLDESRLGHVQSWTSPISHQRRTISATLWSQLATSAHWQKRGKYISTYWLTLCIRLHT